jgi:glycosyltransferase involved in cell wall biosynthesis
MKIAWFTPFAKTSSIGRVSRLITDELSKLSEVHIWHPADVEMHPTNLRTIAFPSSFHAEAGLLADYDIAIYSLGNYLPFHQQIYEISRRAPGIVILHDCVMQDFFAEYYCQYRKDSQAYLDLIARVYGKQARAVFERANSGLGPSPRDRNEIAEYPLFEEACRGAWAVVVHAEFFRRRVAQVFPGPVRRLGMPHRAETDSGALKRSELDIPEDATLILTLGHVNPNKRVPAVLDALAGLPEIRGRFRYVIAGPIDPAYRRSLGEIVDRLGLAEAVSFTGYLSDERVSSLCNQADVCVALRFPSTEGASGSVILEMLHGKAVVVTDAAFFSELPDDCVWKVDLRREAEDLKGALRTLVRDSARRRDMGARAKSYAKEHFRADTYAAGIQALAVELIKDKPLLQYTDRIGETLAAMGVDSDLPILDTVSRITCESFCAEERSMDPASS